MFRPSYSWFVCSLFALSACGGGGGGDSGGGGGAQTASLTVLDLAGATLTPAFSPDVLAYTSSVTSSVSAVTLSASAPDGFTISVNGAAPDPRSVTRTLPLIVGANPIAITLTSADAATSKTYSVNVTRAPIPALSALEVSGAELSPAFAPDVTSYSADVGFLTMQTAVTASVAASDATIEVNNTATASGQPSNAVPLAIGANTLSVRITTAEGESRDYSIALQRQPVSQFAEQFQADESGNFGQAIALSGDTLVVGNPLFANNTGQVVVFTRNGNTWTEQQSIDPLDFLPPVQPGLSPTTFDRFGASVAVSGNTLVVGAPGDNGPSQSTPNSGAVYIYRRVNGVWGTADAQVARLYAVNPSAEDNFGERVAFSGNTVAVGAPYEDSSVGGINVASNNNFSAAGAAYVFTENELTMAWTQQAYIKAADPDAGDRFGHSLALDGETLVVGSPGDDNEAISSQNDIGAAYVFTRSGTTWSQRTELRPSDSVFYLSQNYADSVALSGDTLAIGVPSRDVSSADPNENSGGVFVYVGSGSSWTEQAILDPMPNDAGDRFGWSVALQGDTLLVGSIYEDSGSTGVNSTPNESSSNSGAAYVFMRDGANWLERAYIKASDPSNNAFFGFSVAIDGNSIAVGAEGTSAAYVFR